MKTPTIELVGKTCGRWTVLGVSDKVGPQAFMLCRCECGTERVVGSASLRNGASRSCGCLKRDVQAALHTKHGQIDSPEYSCWQSMISRCHNPNSGAYPDYGGRGITVCDRWRNSFADFRADMGERPSSGHSIGRIDNDGNYEPGNCRWETQSEQNRNKRNNHLVTCHGLTMTIQGWSERTGVPFTSIAYRLRNGWDVAEALETPTGAFDRMRYKDKDRKVVTLTMGGETLTVAQWSRRTGIGGSAIRMRKKAGLSDEEALTRPVIVQVRKIDTQGEAV